MGASAARGPWTYPRHTRGQTELIGVQTRIPQTSFTKNKTAAIPFRGSRYIASIAHHRERSFCLEKTPLNIWWDYLVIAENINFDEIQIFSSTQHADIVYCRLNLLLSTLRNREATKMRWRLISRLYQEKTRLETIYVLETIIIKMLQFGLILACNKKSLNNAEGPKRARSLIKASNPSQTADNWQRLI